MRYLAPTAFPIQPQHVLAGLRATRGDAMAELRATLAARLGVDAIYPVASGRTALALLLRQLRTMRSAQNPPRDEVVLPAYTCPSLIRVIWDAGLTPRLVDMEPATLSLRPECLQQALSARTLAVIVVHPFGLALDVEPALAAARAAGAVLIEDAAQALGATRGRRAVGSRGDFGLFSAGPGKPLALGGGGFLAVNGPGVAGPGAGAEVVGQLEAAWRALPQGGALAAMWSLLKLALVGAIFHPWGWRVAANLGITRAGDSEAGQGYAMRGLEQVQARAALALLPVWEQANARRRATAHALMQDLAGSRDFVLPAHGENCETAADESGSIYLRLPVLANDRAARDACVARLQQNGIGAGKMYGVTLAERYPALGVDAAAFPGAVELAHRLFTLPTHHHVTAADCGRIIALLNAGPITHAES